MLGLLTESSDNFLVELSIVAPWWHHLETWDPAATNTNI